MVFIFEWTCLDLAAMSWGKDLNAADYLINNKAEPPNSYTIEYTDNDQQTKTEPQGYKQSH